MQVLDSYDAMSYAKRGTRQKNKRNTNQRSRARPVGLTTHAPTQLRLTVSSCVEIHPRIASEMLFMLCGVLCRCERLLLAGTHVCSEWLGSQAVLKAHIFTAFVRARRRVRATSCLRANH